MIIQRRKKERKKRKKSNAKKRIDIKKGRTYGNGWRRTEPKMNFEQNE